jgi:hypothetical protein
MWAIKDRTKNIKELKDCMKIAGQEVKRQARAIRDMIKAHKYQDADEALFEVL